MHFEQIFVINLDRRSDRMAQFIEEANKIGFEYERISAIEGGAYGCTQSHLKIAKIAKERNLKNYLALEDDAVFCENFNDKFNCLINQVPEWDILLLGGNHQGGFNKQTDGVIRVFGSYTTHAMAVSETFYYKFIEALENTTVECDVALAALHKSHNVYAFYPSLVTQRQGYSDVLNKEVNYSL